MALPDQQHFDAHEYSRGVLAPARVTVSTEYPVVLSINGNPYVVLACSGSDLEYLALGHLRTDGIISSPADVRGIAIDEQGLSVNITTEMNDGMIERLFRLRSIASGCGQESATVFDGPLPPNPAIPYLRADTVLRSMKEFLRSSEAYGRTHGVHSAGLYTVEGERMAFFEEIGRHNAVDKVMGFAAKEGVPLGGTMLLSTGRLSSEIVQKASAGPIPAIVSRAAPTSRSVEMARRQNIMMVGRVRGSGFIVYHGAEHIVC